MAVDATFTDDTAFEMYLDGTPLTHYNGAVDENAHNGSFFFALSAVVRAAAIQPSIRSPSKALAMWMIWLSRIITRPSAAARV
jgi:hypothetical protein